MNESGNTGFVVDFSALFAGEKLRESFRTEFNLSEFAMNENDVIGGTAYVSGDAVNRAGYVELSLEIRLDMAVLCSRCAADMKYTDKIFEVVPLCMSLENEDTDEYVIIENCLLDVTALCRELILLHLPFRYLCSEDCKGLCAECGTNLNEKQCECGKDNIDPRLSKLKDFYKN